MATFIASVAQNAESLGEAASRTTTTVSGMAGAVNDVAKIASEADRISARASEDAKTGGEAVVAHRRRHEGDLREHGEHRPRHHRPRQALAGDRPHPGGDRGDRGPDQPAGAQRRDRGGARRRGGARLRGRGRRGAQARRALGRGGQGDRRGGAAGAAGDDRRRRGGALRRRRGEAGHRARRQGGRGAAQHHRVGLALERADGARSPTRPASSRRPRPRCSRPWRA